MAPLIGISCGSSPDRETVTLNTHYIQAIAESGGLPVIIPLVYLERIPEYIKLLDGLLLTGGGDIAPFLFGRNDPAGLTQNANLQRDYLELALMSRAFARELPVLGICRGMQVINVYCQGSLFLDLDKELSGAWLHDSPSGAEEVLHPIRFSPGSRLSRIYGELALVNSSHHQAVRKLGYGLLECASSPDGVIEAIEGKWVRWLVGVQWHPERLLANGGSRALFQEFIQQATNYAKRKKFFKIMV